MPSDSLRKFLETATQRYHESLSEEAERYLTQERGLTREILDRFHIGYVNDPLPGHEAFRGRLSIPYMSPDGSVGTIRFRALGDDNPKFKYLSFAGDSPKLFNTTAFERQGNSGIVICEGEIDTMTAVMCGLPAVGIPGASSFMPIWCRPLVQYTSVYLLQDDDEAGRKMAEMLGTHLDTLRPIVMTGGDVNSFYREFGADALKAKILK